MKKIANKIMGLILALAMVVSVIAVADIPAKASTTPLLSGLYSGGKLATGSVIDSDEIPGIHVDNGYRLEYRVNGSSNGISVTQGNSWYLGVGHKYIIKACTKLDRIEDGEDITVISLTLSQFFSVSFTGNDTWGVAYVNNTVVTEAAYGDTVTIVANAIDDPNKIFDKWTSEDGVTFADATSSTTTFTMPANAVTLKANAKDKKKYTVKYDAHGGTGSLADTENVYLGDIFGLPSKTVFTAPEGKEFSHWTVSGVDALFEAGSTVEIVENIAQNGIITVTANWKKKENADDDDDDDDVDDDNNDDVDDDNNDDVDDGNKDDDKNDDDDNPTGGKTVYNIVKGAGAEYTKGSNEGLEFIFKGDAEEDKAYENCKGYDIDLNDIPEGMGSLTKGSAVINIKPEYLDTLPAGEHMLNVYFTDGDTVHVTFNVKDAEKAAEKTDKKDETPKSDTAKKTGDSTNAALILSIMLLTSVGAAYVIGKRKKMNEE